MTRIRSAALALAVAAGCALAGPALAGGPGGGPAQMQGPMQGQGRKMSPERQQAHQQMLEQMRAHDARLEELVTAMNQARGQAKVDAIAAVVNELVAQRRTMRAHVEQMQQMRGQGTMSGPGGAGPGGPPKTSP